MGEGPFLDSVEKISSVSFVSFADQDKRPTQKQLQPGSANILADPGGMSRTLATRDLRAGLLDVVKAMKCSRRTVLFALLALCACHEPASHSGDRRLLSSLSSCDGELIARAVDQVGVEGLNAFVEGESPARVRRTPLWWAITRECDDGVTILLAAGADPNQPTDSEPDSGLAPLSWAAVQRRTHAARSLIEL